MESAHGAGHLARKIGAGGTTIANTREEDAGSNEPEKLGEEGDVCSQCGTVLAIDQRYCLNCGTPRSEPRLDYQRALGEKERAGASASGPASGGVGWSPLFVVLAIAALGVMLLLGVLIGKDDNEVTVTEVPASTTTTTTPTATAPATTTPIPTETTPTETVPGTETVPPDTGAGETRTQPDDAAGGLSAPGGTD
jgi:hypothetical protein